ncbi:MAG: S-layer homology domain-containing protein [Hominilimicola sp.]
MRKYRFTACLIAALLSTSTVFADFNYSADYSDERVVISGVTSTETEEVSVQVYKSDDGNISDSNSILFNDQCTSDGGKYEFPFRYDGAENGIYEINVRESGTDKIYTKKVKLVPKQEYITAISELNNAAQTSEQAFIDAFNTYGNVFDIDEELKNGKSFQDSVKKLAAGVKDNQMNAQNNQMNNKVVNTYVVLNAVKQSEIKNVTGYLDYLQQDDAFIDNLSKICTSDAKAEYLTSKLKNVAVFGIDGADKSLREALILTAARHSNVGALKALVEKYGSDVGMQLSSIKSYAYSSVSGKDYDSAADLNTALKDAKSPEGGNGGSGGGGGSGSSGNKSNSTGSTGVTFPGTGKAEVPEIKARFIDLNTVEWAYEAIMALADNGIVNGKTDNEFYPNDKVTREEFAKLLVCMAKLENSAYSSDHFTDVDADAWYSKYVNIAYENGICNGIGDGNFGVGNEITRQDMAVMVHNLLKSGNEAMNPLHTEFADDEDISDYAKPAVSSLSAMGIINGVGDNMFAPKDNATRAQAAVIIYAAYKRMNGVISQ